MIRMARFGAKKKPSYRVVVIDKERARNSRSVEVVGLYNPVSQPQVVKLDHERIAYWMKNGAQPSDTVSRLLKKNPAPEPAAVGEQPRPAIHTARWSRWVAAAAVVFLAIVAGAWALKSRFSPAVHPIRTVAVLPFRTLGDDRKSCTGEHRLEDYRTGGHGQAAVGS